jgi:hypothetical protein
LSALFGCFGFFGVFAFLSMTYLREERATTVAAVDHDKRNPRLKP